MSITTAGGRAHHWRRLRTLLAAFERMNRHAPGRNLSRIEAAISEHCRALGLTATQRRAAINAGLNEYGRTHADEHPCSIGRLNTLEGAAIGEGVRIANAIAGVNGHG